MLVTIHASSTGISSIGHLRERGFAGSCLSGLSLSKATLSDQPFSVIVGDRTTDLTLVNGGSRVVSVSCPLLTVHPSCSYLSQKYAQPPEGSLKGRVVVIPVNLLKSFPVGFKSLVTGLKLTRGRERRTSIAIN
jgi:hypothetical protein